MLHQSRCIQSSFGEQRTHKPSNFRFTLPYKSYFIRFDQLKMEPAEENAQTEIPVFEDVDGIEGSPPDNTAATSSASGKLGEENLLEAQEQDDVDDNLPKSSAENIIPLEKLKNGWLAVSGFMMSSAQKAKASAVEAYNSESVTNFKRRTSEATISAWEKTVEVTAPALEKTYEVAAPVWTNAVESATYAAEKAKENAIIASETVSFLILSGFPYPYSNYRL